MVNLSRISNQEVKQVQEIKAHLAIYKTVIKLN